MTPRLVDIESVRYQWPGVDGFGLDIAQLAIDRRERVLLIGPSGSGKSTLLALVAGIVPPASGRIAIAGQDLGRLSASACDRFRAEHMGVIFQMFNLLPYGSAIDNVLLPLSFAPNRRSRVGNALEQRTEAHRLLARLGLDPGRIGAKRATELSVGQQQRVAAARALIGAPDLIIADEPTSALDPDIRDQFLDLLFAELDRAAAGLLMVSHDSALEPRFDRVIRLGDIIRPTATPAATIA